MNLSSTSCKRPGADPRDRREAPSPVGADRSAEYESALPFPDFLAAVRTNGDLWRAASRRAVASTAQQARAAALSAGWRLLVLLEDWCLDAVSTVPHVARLAERAPGLELRVLARDANPALMDEHLTGGARAIPVVMVLDADGVERAWWGPRPAALQQWVRGPGMQLAKEARHLEVRRWYARDRGATTLDELLATIEDAVAGAPAAPACCAALVPG